MSLPDFNVTIFLQRLLIFPCVFLILWTEQREIIIFESLLTTSEAQNLAQVKNNHHNQVKLVQILNTHWIKTVSLNRWASDNIWWAYPLDILVILLSNQSRPNTFEGPKQGGAGGGNYFRLRATLDLNLCLAGQIQVNYANSKLIKWPSRAICCPSCPRLISLGAPFWVLLNNNSCSLLNF